MEDALEPREENRHGRSNVDEADQRVVILDKGVVDLEVGGTTTDHRLHGGKGCAVEVKGTIARQGFSLERKKWRELADGEDEDIATEREANPLAL